MRTGGRGPLLKNKILPLAGLKKKLEGLRKQGKKIVFTNGCFDILHYGHVMYLEAARKKGDILVVGLNTDPSVRKLKGAKRPIIPQKDRALLLAALEPVSFVILFGEETPLGLIRSLKPDVLVKGADWNTNRIVGAEVVRSYGGTVTTIKLAQGRSTSAIIKRIAELYR